MDYNTLKALYMALLVIGYRFSQTNSIAINLPIRSNLGLEEGV
jgi:hypothetical protein